MILDPFAADNASPLDLFHAWFAEAKQSEINDPNAMALATCTPAGVPSVRIVLMKVFDAEGLVFYSNRDSRKGGELTANPQAAVVFHWKSLQRQIRIEGSVAEISAAEADAYFKSRYRISQIGAWASHQSRPLDSRATLETRTAAYEAEYPGEVPRPPYWTGFRLTPRSIEFWQERPHRLHDRVVFTEQGGIWAKQRLYP
jgi:pyridoxamine 5'-phosphate oxidase